MSGNRPPKGVKDVKWDQSEKPLSVDPSDNQPFNPLDTRNLAIAVGRALLEKEARPLGRLDDFRGAGIYAIYYAGTFPAYAPIAAENADRRKPRWPIYVGKAIPEGGRKGKFTVDASATRALFNRLREHAESIRATSSLNIDDFACRYLVVNDLWIPLAESLLITHFGPVWNNFIDGFGNHDPGSGRYQGLRPRWDVLHPGRGWAAKCREREESADDIAREVVQHLRSALIPSFGAMGDVGGK